jgi:hypothetical protein
MFLQCPETPKEQTFGPRHELHTEKAQGTWNLSLRIASPMFPTNQCHPCTLPWNLTWIRAQILQLLYSIPQIAKNSMRGSSSSLVHGAEMWWCFSLHFCAPEETRINELHVPSLGQCLHARIPGHSATLIMNSNNLFDNVMFFHELLMKKMVGQWTCTYKEYWLKPSIQTI